MTLDNNFEAAEHILSVKEKSFNYSLEKNTEGVPARNFDKIKIKAPVNGGTRVRNKHRCKFCEKDFYNLKRHFQSDIHKNEPEVISMLAQSSESGNKNSKKPMQKLIGQGDEVFNNDPINKKELRVARRPNRLKVYEKKRAFVKGSDYCICPNCKLMVRKFTRHFKVCTGLSVGNCKNVKSLGKKLMPNCAPNACDRMRHEILSRMREDNKLKNIRHDGLLVEYGNQLCKHLREPKAKFNIANQLRRLASIKILMKEKKFANIMVAYKVDSLINAIETLASGDEYNASQQFLKFPTVAENMGTIIKAICETRKIQLIKAGSLEELSTVQNFRDTFEVVFKTSLSRMCSRSRTMQRMKKKEDPPPIEDIKTLLCFLRRILKKSMKSLSENPHNVDAIITLTKASCSLLQVFNYRRPGDVECIFLDQFERIISIKEDSNKQYVQLHKNIEKIGEDYGLLTTMGKLGRKIKLLVPTDLRNCLQKLFDLRKENCVTGVPLTNPYLFALPSTILNKIRFVNAYTCLSNYSKACGASRPELLHATNLRKHLATSCLELDLNDAELDDLTNFMGHSRQVHCGIYRRQVVARDIPIIVKFLQNAIHSNEDAEDHDNSTDMTETSIELLDAPTGPNEASFEETQESVDGMF